MAKACFANGMSMLRSYAVGNAGDNIIRKYNGKFGWYDEALAGDASTNRGKWDQDFTAFNGLSRSCSSWPLTWDRERGSKTN